MAILIGTALVLLSIGVVLYPFFKPRVAILRAASATDPVDDQPDLGAVYDAIQTLQLEHQLGNVTEGLYREQLDGYRLQAATILRRQMEGESQDADWALEEEIKVARASLSSSNAETIACPNCDARIGSSLGQCPECGVELSDGSATPAESADLC